MPTSLQENAKRALADLGRVVASMAPGAADDLISAIVGAKRIALHGLGREGLQMRGFAMRLFHLGLDAHVVGDMSLPPLGKGDLLIISAGPGDIPSTATLMVIAKEAGAKTVAITAQPTGGAAKRADAVLYIPAQTMANDQGESVSILPMGSLYEAALMLVFEVVVLELMKRLGETYETMRLRHTNIE